MFRVRWDRGNVSPSCTPAIDARRPLCDQVYLSVALSLSPFWVGRLTVLSWRSCLLSPLVTYVAVWLQGTLVRMDPGSRGHWFVWTWSVCIQLYGKKTDCTILVFYNLKNTNPSWCFFINTTKPVLRYLVLCVRKPVLRDSSLDSFGPYNRPAVGEDLSWKTVFAEKRCSL